MVVRKSSVEVAELIDAALTELVGRIEVSLAEFVHHRGEAKVLVFANELGHLHAVVATHGFEGVPKEERVRRIWDHLRSHESLTDVDLGYLYKVHAFTNAEYNARVGASATKSSVAEWLNLESDPGDIENG